MEMTKPTSKLMDYGITMGQELRSRSAQVSESDLLTNG